MRRPYAPKLPCPNCNNIGMYQDYDWLSGKTYYFFCPTCELGKQLKKEAGKEMFECNERF